MTNNLPVIVVSTGYAFNPALDTWALLVNGKRINPAITSMTQEGLATLRHRLERVGWINPADWPRISELCWYPEGVKPQ